MEAAPFIPVSEPLIGDNTHALVNECVETGWVSSEGRFIPEFEQKFSQFCGAAHGVAVSNGTTALQVAMKALSLEPGSEVIIPSYTIISCAIAVLACIAQRSENTASCISNVSLASCRMTAAEIGPWNG